MNAQQVDKVRLVVAIVLLVALIALSLAYWYFYVVLPELPAGMTATPGATLTPMDVNPGGAGDWWGTRVAPTGVGKGLP